MTNYTIEITDDLARAEVRINAYLVLEDYHNTCNKIIEGFAKPFASLSLTNDEYDFMFEEGENPNQMMMSQDFFDNFDFVPFSELPRVEDFFGSLDTYARQHLKENKVKGYFACRTCGAFTTDPTHSMITYFHKDCQGVA
jgi:hypothetical protein